MALQCGTQHSRHTAGRGLTSAAEETTRALVVLGLKALGIPGCQGQHHSAAQHFISSFAWPFFKSRSSLSKVFWGRWRE